MKPTSIIIVTNEGKDRTPVTFDQAAIGGSTDEMAQLISEGMDIDQPVIGAEGATALIIAAYENDSAMTRLLLEHSADFTLRDNKGFTALRTALENGNFDVADLLTQSGATE